MCRVNPEVLRYPERDGAIPGERERFLEMCTGGCKGTGYVEVDSETEVSS